MTQEIRVTSILLLLGGLLSGCTPHAAAPTSPHALPVAVRKPASTLPSTTVEDPHTTAMRHLHSQPLYQQAEADCKAHQYREAATLLDQLAQSPGLSPAEIAIAQQQEAICLKDAHLPVPAALQHLPTAAASTPVVTPLHPLSAADADCGPRALAIVCKELGIKTDLAKLRELTGTTEKGTSMEGLATAAKALGLKPEGVQLSREALGEATMPAIAYVNSEHYVAVLKLSGAGENGTALIHDPNKAQPQTITQEQLLRACSGYVLLLK